MFFENILTFVGFYGKNLDKQEEQCVLTCASKYMLMNKRVGLRFQDHQMKQQQEMIEKMQQQGR